MGPWSHDIFDNDDAMDFIAELESHDEASLTDIINDIANAEAERYLELPECSYALAAIEMIAALNGKPSADLPEEAQDWIVDNSFVPAANLLRLCQNAIDRILADSELRDAWSEGGEGELRLWKSTVDDLRRRISE